VTIDPATRWPKSRVNCRGILQKSAQAFTGCPGVAASSPPCSSEQDKATGHRSGCGLAIARSRIGIRLRQMRLSSGSADGLKRSFLRPAVTRQAGNHVPTRPRGQVGGRGRAAVRIRVREDAGEPRPPRQTRCTLGSPACRARLGPPVNFPPCPTWRLRVRDPTGKPLLRGHSGARAEKSGRPRGETQW